MTRLRRFLHVVRAALVSDDALAIAGIASVAFGAWLAWPPAGFLVLGFALLVTARTEAK